MKCLIHCVLITLSAATEYYHGTLTAIENDGKLIAYATASEPMSNK